MIYLFIVILLLLSVGFLWILPITDLYNNFVLPIDRSCSDIILINYNFIISCIVLFIVENIYFFVTRVIKKKTSKQVLILFIVLFFIFNVITVAYVELNFKYESNDYNRIDINSGEYTELVKPENEDSLYYPYFDTLKNNNSDSFPTFSKVKYSLFSTEYIHCSESGFFYTDEYYEDNSLDGEIICYDDLLSYQTKNKLLMKILNYQFKSYTISMNSNNGTIDNVNYSVYYNESDIIVCIKEQNTFFVFKIHNPKYYGLNNDTIISSAIKTYKKLLDI